MATTATTAMVNLDNARKLYEVIIQFVAIRIGTILLVGHLTTLRGLSKKEQLYHVAYFIISPLFPLVYLVSRFTRVVYIACKRPWPDDKLGYLAYLFSMVLDMKATTIDYGEAKDSGIDLFNAPYSHLQRVSTSWSLLTLARVFGLLVGLAQSAASATICLRRMTLPRDMIVGSIQPVSNSSTCVTCWVEAYSWTPAVATPDSWNFLYAIGGLVTVTISLAISICGWSWEIQRNSSHIDTTHDLELLKLLGVSSAYSSIIVSAFYWFGPRNSLFSTWLSEFSFSELWAPVIGTVFGILLSTLILLPKTEKPAFLRKLVAQFFPLEAYTGILIGYGYGGGIVQFCFMLWGCIMDMKELNRCQAVGSGCNFPLISWKDPWSDKLWTF